MAENVKVTRWLVYGSVLVSMAAGQRKQTFTAGMGRAIIGQELPVEVAL
jgi:hypothetical protein